MKKMTLLFFTVELSVLIFMVCGCGPPSRTPVELSPETLEILEPYLAQWSTMVPDDAYEEIELITSQLEDRLGIEYLGIGYYKKLTFESDVYIMVIMLEAFYDWTRGYLYVPDGSLLESNSTLEVKRLDEH